LVKVFGDKNLVKNLKEFLKKFYQKPIGLDLYRLKAMDDARHLYLLSFFILFKF
tara:strand:+ start:294 stop:455 length:162 start_codon:yes stop_codon:yes gene_type:complete